MYCMHYEVIKELVVLCGFKSLTEFIQVMYDALQIYIDNVETPEMGSPWYCCLYWKTY